MARWPRSLFATATGLFALPAALVSAPEPMPTGVGAEGACVRHGMRLFPEFASWFANNRARVLREQGISPEPVLPEMPAIGIPMDIRLTDALGFVATFPDSVRDTDPASDLTCIGDMHPQRITSVRYQNVMRRPEPGEVWSF